MPGQHPYTYEVDSGGLAARITTSRDDRADVGATVSRPAGGHMAKPAKSFETLSFGDGVDQLRASYRRGLLVPFIGSGLSAPKMRGWSSLVRALADAAGIEDLHLPERPTDQQLILASERVVWQLRARGHSLGTKMDDALPDPGNSGMDVPSATQALASVWWPLVLTTNYDDLFLKSFNKRHQLAKRHDADAMAVLGRGAADCHTVLNSLNQSYRPLLWALQGFLGPSLHGADLRPEIVLGYEQYRRATFENAAFRSAFTELFRNRSFLFAGSGLSEDYFRGLFGESIVRLGVHQHAHCALINEKDLGQDTPWFLHTRLNIVVATYADPVGGPKYSGFAPCLEEIAEALNEPPRGGRRFWVRNILPASVCVDIEPTALPPWEGETHWIVGSVGRGSSDETLISSDVPKTLHGTEVEVPGHDDLLRIEGRNVLLAIARKSKKNGGATRDLRHVADVTSHALSVAADQGATTVSLMLLSASPHAGRWPRVFSLVEMLRGIRHYAYSRPRGRHAPLRVILHDTAAARPADRAPSYAVWYAIESGRFDPAEVLDCKALRLFVEIHLEGEIIRMPMYVFDNKTIGQVANYLGLAEGWEVLLDPDPAPKRRAKPINSTQYLLDAGVVPGSTLRFRRR